MKNLEATIERRIQVALDNQAFKVQEMVERSLARNIHEIERRLVAANEERQAESETMEVHV
jgi:hypothetical protein